MKVQIQLCITSRTLPAVRYIHNNKKLKGRVGLKEDKHVLGTFCFIFVQFEDCCIVKSVFILFYKYF